LSEVKPEDRILNCIPSKKMKNDWGFTAAVGSNILEAPPEIPPSVDLREDWWAIGDQKDTGSCVGWASADAILRWHMVKARKIENNEKLSVRFQWKIFMRTSKVNIGTERLAKVIFILCKIQQ